MFVQLQLKWINKESWLKIVFWCSTIRTQFFESFLNCESHALQKTWKSLITNATENFVQWKESILSRNSPFESQS